MNGSYQCGRCVKLEERLDHSLRTDISAIWASRWPLDKRHFESEFMEKQSEADMKLIYSPDDGGYYFQRYSDWKCSQLFDTLADAHKAQADNRLSWD